MFAVASMATMGATLSISGLLGGPEAGLGGGASRGGLLSTAPKPQNLSSETDFGNSEATAEKREELDLREENGLVRDVIIFAFLGAKSGIESHSVDVEAHFLVLNICVVL